MAGERHQELMMKIEIEGEIWFWKGPAPHHFVTIPEKESGEIQSISAYVTYGWGMIPVAVRIGGSAWKTALFPKDGLYIVPINAKVRSTEMLEKGDNVTIRLEVRR